MNEPDLTKAKRYCDCKTGRLNKLLSFNKDSRSRERATHRYCTFRCMNCGAMWRVESWLRGAGWTDIKWTKTKKGNRA